MPVVTNKDSVTDFPEITYLYLATYRTLSVIQSLSLLKAGVDRCSFQTKNQMVFVKKTHCKMWLYFDMVVHRRVIKGY